MRIKNRCLITVLLMLCLTFVFALAACGENSQPSTPTEQRILWGTLVGTVTENGEGLAGVTVTSGDETATTDASGNYSIKVYNNGATVSFEKQGCITQKKTFKSSSFYTEEIRYDFIMFISAKVEGVVKDKNGAAVSGATVSVGIQSVETGADGKFVFDQVIGTSMVIIVTKDGKSARKPVYTEQLRTGFASVEIILE